MVIDALALQLFGKPFDRNGALAAKGNSAGAGAQSGALRNPYFRLKPPRTAGREQFGREYAASFLAACRRSSSNPAGRLATATALTAETIAQSYKRFVLARMKSGRNRRAAWITSSPAAARAIDADGHAGPAAGAAWAANWPPARSSAFPSEAKEAAAFALLAWQTWHHRPGNLPAATGATQDRHSGAR